MNDVADIRVHAVTVLHDFVMADLGAAFPDFSASPNWSEAEIVARQPAVLVVSSSSPLTADHIASLPPSVRVIATYSVGLNHIDLAAARARGLVVLNTPDVLNNAVAEIALFLLLGAARRATENIGLLRDGAWHSGAGHVVGVELKDRTLGIFGMGRIGRRIAELARAFGMTIAYCNRNRLDGASERGARWHPSLEAMLPEIDALMIAAPATPETRGIIGSRQLNRAKPGMLLVNIARGELVEDDALIAALEDGRVLAAGLDVFANEPNVDPRYFALPNVFMLPHVGSASYEARRAMGQILIDGVMDLHAGRTPVNLVA